jgi:hypothetical protein
MQTTLTIKGIKLTASSIRKSPQSEATGGHNIAMTKAGEIHWMAWDDNEVHIFNAGAVRRNAAFGAKVVFLAA